MHWFNIAVAFGLAYLRITGDKTQVFQAVAHLFMGGLVVDGWHKPDKWSKWSLSWFLLVVLSIIETACAIHDRS